MPGRWVRSEAMALCLACSLAWSCARAQDVTFKMDVKLVNVFVNVTDQNGAIVGSLSRDQSA